jgi:hypothetical protein
MPLLMAAAMTPTSALNITMASLRLRASLFSAIQPTNVWR